MITKKGVLVSLFFLLILATFASNVRGEIAVVTTTTPEISVNFLGLVANLTSYSVKDLNTSEVLNSSVLTCHLHNGSPCVYPSSQFFFKFNSPLIAGHEYSFIINYSLILGSSYKDGSASAEFLVNTNWVNKHLVSLKVLNDLSSLEKGKKYRIQVNGIFDKGNPSPESDFNVALNDSSVVSYDGEGHILTAVAPGSFNLSVWKLNSMGENISTSVVGRVVPGRSWGFYLDSPKPLSDEYSSDGDDVWNLVKLDCSNSEGYEFNFKTLGHVESCDYTWNSNSGQVVISDNQFSLSLKPSDGSRLVVSCSNGSLVLKKKYEIVDISNPSYSLSIDSVSFDPNPTSNYDDKNKFSSDLKVITNIPAVCNFSSPNSTDRGFMLNSDDSLESLDDFSGSSSKEHHSTFFTETVGSNDVEVSCYSINDSASGSFSEVSKSIILITQQLTFEVRVGYKTQNSGSITYLNPNSNNVYTIAPPNDVVVQVNTSQPVSRNNVFIYLNNEEKSRSLDGPEQGTSFSTVISHEDLSKENTLDISIFFQGYTYSKTITINYENNLPPSFYLNLSVPNKELVIGQSEQFTLRKCLDSGGCLDVDPSKIIVDYSPKGVVSVDRNTFSVHADEIGSTKVTFWYQGVNVSVNLSVVDGLHDKGLDFWMIHPKPISYTNHSVPLSNKTISSGIIKNVKLDASSSVQSCNYSWYRDETSYLPGVFSKHSSYFTLDELDISKWWHTYLFKVTCYNSSNSTSKLYHFISSDTLSNLSVDVDSVRVSYSEEGAHIFVNASTNLPSICRVTSFSDGSLATLFSDSSIIFSNSHSILETSQLFSDTKHHGHFYTSSFKKTHYLVVCRSIGKDEDYQYASSDFSVTLNKAQIHIVSPPHPYVDSVPFTLGIQTTTPMKNCFYHFGDLDETPMEGSGYNFEKSISLEHTGVFTFHITCYSSPEDSVSRDYSLYYDESPPELISVSGLTPFKNRTRSNFTNALWLKVKAVDNESGVSRVQYFIYSGHPSDYTDEELDTDYLFTGSYPYTERVHWINLPSNSLFYNYTYFIRARVWNYAGLPSEFKFTTPILIVKHAIYDHCFDGYKNSGETDVDCGGSCGPCDVNMTCKLDSDCLSDICNQTTFKCMPSNKTVDYCSDHKKDNGETDVDCGGPCQPCTVGKNCSDSSDCAVGDSCVNGICLAEKGSECSYDTDCVGNLTCSDGRCLVPDGQACNTSDDCASHFCNDSNVCASPSSHCDNWVLDGDETDVDCGGSCSPCSLDENCKVDSDCSSGYCDPVSSTCSNPPDETQNETLLPIGSQCYDNSECASGYCDPNTYLCSEPKHSSWLLWLLIILLLVGGLGVGAYLILSKKSGSKKSNHKGESLSFTTPGSSSTFSHKPSSTFNSQRHSLSGLSPRELMKIREKARMDEDKRRIMNAFSGHGTTTLPHKTNKSNKHEHTKKAKNVHTPKNGSKPSSLSAIDELEVGLPMRLLLTKRIKGKDVWDKLDKISSNVKPDSVKSKLNELSSKAKDKKIDEVIHKAKTHHKKG